MMKTIYIGGRQRNKKTEGSKWKISMYLFLFFALTGAALKAAAPIIAETWLNQKGASTTGYAFSVREVDLSLGKGQMILKDVKVFSPKTSSELLEVPHMTITLNWSDLVLSQEKKVSVFADKIDLVLSKDFASELARIKTTGNQNKELYLDAVDGKIGKLNLIERREDQSRTVLELNNVDLKVKEISLHSINLKTEFSVSSDVADGGKLSLAGKTNEANGSTPWSIHGSLKQVPTDIFNKIAGQKLPFGFYESNLDAEIRAHSEHGKVSGEISPQIQKLNLLEERPGIPTQFIKRMLTDDLTFTLPFTLKDELTLQFADVYQKLKNYRRYPAAVTAESSVAPDVPVTRSVKVKKSDSWWPF